MPWTTDWVTGYAPHRDRSTFDRTIAGLRLDEEPVGYVAFRLNRHVTRTGGRLWWTKRSVPFDVVEWLELLMPGTPDQIMQDGVSDVGELTDQVHAGIWSVNPVMLRGHAGPDAGSVLTLRLLEGGERDRAWREFGWGDD